MSVSEEVLDRLLFDLSERWRHGERTFLIGQANNAFVFPGIGLGVMVAEARTVTDGMLAAAARALAEEVHDEHLDASCLFPPPTFAPLAVTPSRQSSCRLGPHSSHAPAATIASSASLRTADLRTRSPTSR